MTDDASNFIDITLKAMQNKRKMDHKVLKEFLKLSIISKKILKDNYSNNYFQQDLR